MLRVHLSGAWVPGMPSPDGHGAEKGLVVLKSCPCDVILNKSVVRLKLPSFIAGPVTSVHPGVSVSSCFASHCAGRYLVTRPQVASR